VPYNASTSADLTLRVPASCHSSSPPNPFGDSEVSRRAMPIEVFVREVPFSAGKSRTACADLVFTAVELDKGPPSIESRVPRGPRGTGNHCSGSLRGKRRASTRSSLIACGIRAPSRCARTRFDSRAGPRRRCQCMRRQCSGRNVSSRSSSACAHSLLRMARTHSR
jgi:hypothetical protein